MNVKNMIGTVFSRIFIWTMISFAAIAAVKTFGPAEIWERLTAFTRSPISRGGEEMQRARFDEAEKAFTKAVAADPQNSEAAYSLGWSLQAQGKDDEALAAYKTALELAHRDKNAGVAEKIASNTGSLYMKKRQFPAAEKAFRTALKYNPSSADAVYQLGLSLQSQKKHFDAREQFAAALKLDPNYLAAKFQLSRVAMAEEVVEKPVAIKAKARSPASIQKKKQKAKHSRSARA